LSNKVIRKTKSKSEADAGTSLVLENPTSWDLPSVQSDQCSLELKATLAKLNVTEQQIQQQPRLTEIMREAHGGLEAVTRAMRLSYDPVVEAFLREYDAAHQNDREIVPWEAWAIRAGVDVRLLIGAIVVALRDQSVTMVKVIATSFHPQTVKARINSAMYPGKEGVRDRDALDQALKFLPTSKGSTFITLPSGTVINTEVPATDQLRDVDAEELFPDLQQTQRLIGG